TWWNGRIASMGVDAANGTPWTEVKGTNIDVYTNRFHELALLCPRMVEPEQVKVEQYIRGLSKNIRGDVTSLRPAGIDETVRMAYQLMGQIIQDNTDEVSEGTDIANITRKPDKNGHKNGKSTHEPRIIKKSQPQSTLIVMEIPNHLNEPNEAIPEVNPVVPEPNQVADIHDPNEIVDIPDDIDLVDYDEDDSEEDSEEEPKEETKEELKEDVDIELEDDAELIFPYEVEGDKTPPPRDVSYDSVSYESESEDEEVDVAPEATVRIITQKPYDIRNFPRGLFEVGESSSTRDSSNVDGLASWALRRDLEASRARARVMEAELGTCQTKIALLKSKDKIKEKERELLNHDLENVKRALGNVLERVSVLEIGENVTLNKRLAVAEIETNLVWARMERDTAERRLHESRVWNKMFYLDMVHIGAVLKPPSDDEDTERPRKKSKNSTSDGTEGPSEPRGPPSDS
nr:hypothetical protein [Tanacetum cinerariifolium]